MRIRMLSVLGRVEKMIATQNNIKHGQSTVLTLPSCRDKIGKLGCEKIKLARNSIIP